MRLIIVRHGETEENVKGICQGQSPGKLTKKGISQTKKLALRLKKRKFDAVYCSDLKRTKDTCHEIIKYHPHTPVKYVKELRERSKGKFEGMHHDDVNALAKKMGIHYRMRPPGGETHGEKNARVMKFYKKMIREHIDDTVLWVTHGEVIHTMIMKLFGLTWAQRHAVRPHNTALTCIDVGKDKKHNVRVVNCVKHL